MPDPTPNQPNAQPNDPNAQPNDPNAQPNDPNAQPQQTGLDAIYNEFNIEPNGGGAPEQTPPTQTQQQTPPANEQQPSSQGQPDLNTVLQKVTELDNKLTEQADRAQEEALNQEFQQAIDAVNAVAKLPEDKAYIVKGKLNHLLESDPRFQAVVDNRKSNPAAFNAALKAVGEELFKETQVAPNAQIDSDRSQFEQGATHQTTNTDGMSPEQQELEKKLEGMSGPQFDGYMRNLASQN